MGDVLGVEDRATHGEVDAGRLIRRTPAGALVPFGELYSRVDFSRRIAKPPNDR
jgi:hypothetical protein